VKHYHVVGLTAGTALLFCAMTACVVGAIVFSTVEVHSKVRPDTFRPKTGALKEIESQIHESQYGPVNLNAAKEVKNGLFDRIRSRRQSAQACQQPSQCTVQPQSVSYSYPAVSYSQPKQIVCDSSDCSYTQIVSSVPMGSVVITQTTGMEMPISKPINPLDDVNSSDCVTCKKDPRSAVKTGSFICSNCRKANVGEWHTDWNEDGTPVTFLCKRCNALVSPQQKEKLRNAYQIRQLGKTGNTGLLHQEIGE
jgi:hypothetical protein